MNFFNDEISINRHIVEVAAELIEGARNKQVMTQEVGAMLACCMYYSLYKKPLPGAYALIPECMSLYRLHCYENGERERADE